MPTTSRSIGTTAEQVAAPSKTKPLLDIVIQNLSTNTVYVGSDSGLTIANGIEVLAGREWFDDQRSEPVFLIATDAASDVRMQYVAYEAGER